MSPQKFSPATTSTDRGPGAAGADDECELQPAKTSETVDRIAVIAAVTRRLGPIVKVNSCRALNGNDCHYHRRSGAIRKPKVSLMTLANRARPIAVVVMARHG
jgi:hypothetical protein